MDPKFYCLDPAQISFSNRPFQAREIKTLAMARFFSQYAPPSRASA
jgi:hypothetical protein